MEPDQRQARDASVSDAVHSADATWRLRRRSSALLRWGAAMGFSKTVTDKAKDVAGDTQDQIQSLRAQVEQLLNERVTPALTDAAGKAETVVHSARDMTTAQVETVSAQVREQPIIAIGIAAAVGYLIGRIAR